MLEQASVSREYRALMKADVPAAEAEILIVEDDEPIARLISLHLRKSGFSTHVCADGAEALRLLEACDWRLVVLDRMLPKASGMKILRWLRREGAPYVPVLMVTALGMPGERVEGLNEGADDYLPKPFEPEELVARVRALLRRERARTSGDAGTGGLRLDEDAPRILDGGRAVEVRPLEYRLMQVLMAAPGRTRSRRYLLDHVWGRDVFVEERTVDVTVKRLREALARLGRKDCIETVRGMGYRFVPPDAE